MRHRIVLRVAGFALLGLCSMPSGFMSLARPAQATAVVDVSADSGLQSAGENSGDDLAAEPYVSGRARATSDTASATVVAGPLPNCGNGSGGCATTVNPPEAGAYAAANGLDGTLRVGAQVTDGSDARARATATLIDTITLTSPVIDIFVDIDAFGEGDAQSPGQTQGRASLFFSMFLDTPSGNPDDPQTIILFSFEVGADEQDAFHIAYLRDDPDGLVIDSGSSVPGFLSYSIDLSSAAFADLFEPLVPNIPPLFDLNGPLAIGFVLSAGAFCDSDNCFAQARADESLHIGLQGLSASGYSYPGIAQEPTPDPIPEPASVFLLLAGLATLAMAGSRSEAGKALRRVRRRCPRA